MKNKAIIALTGKLAKIKPWMIKIKDVFLYRRHESSQED